MVSELGKILRKWRIDKEVSMREMSEAIGVSTAFLSAIELSKKKINDELINKIINYFNLPEPSIQALKDAACKSNGEIKLPLTSISIEDQDGILAFARKYSSLSDEKKDKIRSLLNDE